MLQLINVVDVLHYTVDSALEAFDFNVVVSDLRLVFLDQAQHGLLFGPQIVHCETQL